MFRIGGWYCSYRTPFEKKESRYSQLLTANWEGILNLNLNSTNLIISIFIYSRAILIISLSLFLIFYFQPLSLSYNLFISEIALCCTFSSVILALIYIFNRIFRYTKDTVGWKWNFSNWFRKSRNWIIARIPSNNDMSSDGIWLQIGRWWYGSVRRSVICRIWWKDRASPNSKWMDQIFFIFKSLSTKSKIVIIKYFLVDLFFIFSLS